MNPRLSSPHDHFYLGENHRRNERRTWLVIGITTAMMVLEIVTGTLYGSMALVADGWHMSTHAAAMLIAALAYLFARRNARNPRFSFGTGKLGDLAAFGSAVVLALVALLIAWESVLRLSSPVPISFSNAIAVATLGLGVNLLCAWLLRDDHARHIHEHDETPHAHPGRRQPVRDHNLRAAYLHVLADALTSVLAIVALVFGSVLGWNWMDPLMGVAGSLVILHWSTGLIRDSGRVLLDYVSAGEGLPEEIRKAIETDGDRITDLHVWQLGPGHHGAIVAILSSDPKSPSFYRQKLAIISELSHLTVEVEPVRQEARGSSAKRARIPVK